jgi:pSer/pThr/pTyr-binding forkhead associated (FHA) protein
VTARLTSKGGELGLLDEEFETKLVLGRSPNCDLVLSLPVISGTHAQITFDEALDAYVLEDMDSSHGTSLDGTPVERPETLGHLHVISLAGAGDLLFQDLTKCAARHGAVAPPPRPVAAETPVETPVVAPTPATPQDKGGATVIAPVQPPPTPQAPQAPPAPPAPQTPSEAGGNTVIARVSPPPPSPSTPNRPDRPGDSATQLGAISPPPPSIADAQSSSAPESTAGSDPGASEPKRPAPAPTPPERTELRDSAPSASLRAKLVFTAEVDGISEYPLREGDNSVGRGSGSDVSRLIAELSRTHAIVVVQDGRILVRDLESRHGTFVRGERVVGDVEVQIGDEISFGVDDAKLEAE